MMIWNALLILVLGSFLAIPVSMAKADDKHETMIFADMGIFDVSDSYFERLGIDLETLLPKSTTHAGHTGVVEISTIPQTVRTQVRDAEPVSANEEGRYAILTPLERQLLRRFMNNEDCHGICRPQIRTRPNEVLKYFIDNEHIPNIDGVPSPPLTHLGKDVEVRIAFEMSVTLADDGKSVVINIDSKSQDKTSSVRATVPLGKTLLMCIGTHKVDVVSKDSVPILNKIPFTSRLFKNTRVNSVTWHRLVFITPKIVREQSN